MSLRVLHLTRDLAPRVNGGLSTAVHGLVRASLQAGLPCAVASFDAWRPRARARTEAPPPTSSDEQGLPVLRLSSPTDLAVLAPFARGFRPDLLHVHHGMLWAAAESLRDELDVPTLKSVHVLQAELHRQRGLAGTNLSLDAQRRAIVGADAVHVPSRDAARSLLLDHPAAAGKLHVLGFGVEDSAAARRAAARGQPFGPRLLNAGRFADMKGTAELLAIWPEVAGRVPGARLCLAGGLPENPQAERRWRKRVAALGPAAQRVRLPGWLGPQALAEEYAAAEVLVCPGWFETFGLSALEGMLHGLPVVAADAGGLAELVAHGRTGLLVPPRDPGALAEALCGLLADPPRARALGKAAAEEARQVWSWARLGPRWAALVARVVAGGPPA